MAEHGNVAVFVACDKVIEETQTGKKSLIGMFRNFNFSTLPRKHNPWFLYAQIIDLERGKRDITINVTHDSTQGVAFSARLSIPEEHTENVDIQIEASPTEFDKEGKYHVTLNIDGHQHGQFVLTVTLSNQQNKL